MVSVSFYLGLWKGHISGAFAGFALQYGLVLTYVCLWILTCFLDYFLLVSLVSDVAVSNAILFFPLVLIPYYFLAPFPNLLLIFGGQVAR